jgi:hypothetical protein
MLFIVELHANAASTAGFWQVVINTVDYFKRFAFFVESPCGPHRATVRLGTYGLLKGAEALASPPQA